MERAYLTIKAVMLFSLILVDMVNQSSASYFHSTFGIYVSFSLINRLPLLNKMDDLSEQSALEIRSDFQVFETVQMKIRGVTKMKRRQFLRSRN